MPAELGYIEGENGDISNFRFSKLVQVISYACGYIFNRTWSSTNTTMRK